MYQQTLQPTREEIIRWWAQPISKTDRGTSDRERMDQAMWQQFTALHHEGVWFETGQGGFRLRVRRDADVPAVADEVALALPHIIQFSHRRAEELGPVKVIQLLEHNLSMDGVYWLMVDASERYHIVCSREWQPIQSFDTLIAAIEHIRTHHWYTDSLAGRPEED